MFPNHYLHAITAKPFLLLGVKRIAIGLSMSFLTYRSWALLLGCTFFHFRKFSLFLYLRCKSLFFNLLLYLFTTCFCVFIYFHFQILNISLFLFFFMSRVFEFLNNTQNVMNVCIAISSFYLSTTSVQKDIRDR